MSPCCTLFAPILFRPGYGIQEHDFLRLEGKAGMAPLEMVAYRMVEDSSLTVGMTLVFTGD